MTPEQIADEIMCLFVDYEPGRHRARRKGAIDLIRRSITTAVEAERTRMERHLIDARLRYTEGEYAVGWNNAIESVLNFLDLPNHA